MTVFARGFTVLLVLAVGFVIGCQTAPVPAAPTPDQPAKAAPAPPRQTDPDAVIRFATGEMHRSLDPHTTTSAVIASAHRALFDPLIFADAGGKRVPGLALSWTVVNPTTWEFKLRPNVVFHNGEPFDAETVKFNFERLANPDNRLAASSRVTFMERVEVVDPLTVRFTTRGPIPTWPEYARLVLMVPRRYLEQIGPQAFAERPVGTGPFRFTSFAPGSEFVGDRHPDYWLKPVGFRQLRQSVLAEEAVRMAAFRTGEIDIVERVPAHQADPLAREGFKTLEIIGGVVSGIFFDTTQNTPIDRREVRQALNYGTDKVSIRDRLAAGKGLIVGQIGHPEAAGWNEDVKPYPFDVPRARQLLSQAGFANGFSIKMHATMQATPFHGPESAQFIQQTWGRELNVRVDIDFVEPAIMSGFLLAGGNHPLRLTAQGFGEEVAFIYQFFIWEGQRFPAARRYRNEEFDRLFAQSNAEFDPVRRDAILRQAARVLHEDAAMVFIGNESTHWAFNQRIDGFRVRPGNYHDWTEVVRLR